MPDREKPWIGFPLSDEIYREVGLFIAHWAYFQSEFDEFLDGMLMLPEAMALVKKAVPSQYNKRANLLRDAAFVCFPSCPSLTEKIGKIVEDAESVKVYRDLVAHGRWAIGPNQIVSVHSLKKSGKSLHKDITVELLFDHSIKTSALSRRLMSIKRGGHIFNDHSFPLSQDEIKAVGDFLLRSRPKLPTPNIAVHHR